MTKVEGKIRRAIKRNKKKQSERDLKEKISMFSQLEDQCLVCEKAFDKNNKDMVQSWYVVVREKQDRINLYCPECWTRACSLVNNLKEDINAEQS